MATETFVNHRKYFWLWINLGMVLLLLVIYGIYQPSGGHSGDTVYGYFLGGLATLGIVFLMWYGMRKRSYHSSKSTLKGWLSAHIWFGVSLLVIVPLHSGFILGWNLHSITYYLLIIVVVSGIWGAVNYRRLAGQIQSNRGGLKLQALVEQIRRLSDSITQISQNADSDILEFIKLIDLRFEPSLPQLLLRPLPTAPATDNIQTKISHLSEEDQKKALNLLEICQQKRKLIKTIIQEVRTMALLKLWLLVHLPISLALVFAVILHIAVVFYYK